MLAIHLTAASIVLNMCAGQNDAACAGGHSFAEEAEQFMTHQRCDCQRYQTGGTQAYCRYIPVFVAANSQGYQADGQNQYQHNQVEILFLHKASLDDWEQGHEHWKQQAVHQACA